jgi:hypothetical protein
MDMIRLYYYTSVPLLTCNMLFYSITSLSASISSSQNVVKFIAEHKDCDSVIFKNEIAETDLENKLRIVESLIYDIIKKYSKNADEFERTKKDIQQPLITDTDLIENNEFALVEMKSPTNVLERIDEPIKLALISTSESVQSINTLLMEMRDKINNHNKSYIKTILALSLQIELKNLHRQIKILDSRLHFLLELLKVYMPIREKRNI